MEASVAMLNARVLSEILSENCDERLCKSWYLITRNGTLLANSQPTDLYELRRQAAIAAIAWQEHDSDPGEKARCLVIESEHANVFIRPLFQDLLLVLQGGVPPRRTGFRSHIKMERSDRTSHAPLRDDGSSVQLGGSPDSLSAHEGSTMATSVLRLQRTKVEALSGALMTELQELPMPGELLKDL